MDIYCARCGEPWDMDSLHDAAEERLAQTRSDASKATDAEYQEAYAATREAFRRNGCSAMGSWVRDCEPRDSSRALASAALQDLLGDDLDGVASMLDDLDSVGLLD